jgi:sugar phosphate isomerase/epimerase
MLLTLTVNCLRSRLNTPSPTKGRSRAGASASAAGGETMALNDLPKFTRETLGLFGLNMSTNLLVGADLTRLDGLRDAADKAACPCLVLTESDPQAFGHQDEAAGDAVVERVIRVVKAAHRLGCNSVGLTITGDDNEDTFDTAVERLRGVLSAAERLEVNLLLQPHRGLTEDPERLTDLIKKVGGFRIGTFPDFQTASKTPDPLLHLRRLAPYAAAITASTVSFKPAKKEGAVMHETYDLPDYVKTITSVGYQGTLSIDYRGEGDPVVGVQNTRAVLESILGTEATDG